MKNRLAMNRVSSVVFTWRKGIMTLENATDQLSWLLLPEELNPQILLRM